MRLQEIAADVEAVHRDEEGLLIDESGPLVPLVEHEGRDGVITSSEF